MTTTTSAMTTSSPAERLRSLAGAQLARDGWSRDRLLDHQGERLRALITHAVAASPYYREALGPDAASGDVPLRELPTLPKATLMDNFDRIVTDPGLRRADLEAHLSGPGAEIGRRLGRRAPAGAADAAQGDADGQLRPDRHRPRAAPGRPGGAPVRARRRPALLGRYKLFTTAGTTGGRGQLGAEAGDPAGRDRLPQPAAHLQPGVRGAAGRTGQPGAAAGRDHPAARDGAGPERLPARGPDRPPLGGGRVGRGAAPGPPVEPLNFYGTTEALILAAGRPGQAGMDILEDVVVDQRDRPVPLGVPGHKVLVTSLVSRVQPLLRYELTESVTLAGGPNPLGLPYARIAAVDGRSDDVVTLPAAGGGRVAIHPFRLRTPFSELLEVRQDQVVHEPAGLLVKVALRDTAPADTPARSATPWPASSATPARPAPDRGHGRSRDRPRPRPRRQVQAHQEHHAARPSPARGGALNSTHRWMRAPFNPIHP